MKINLEAGQTIREVVLELKIGSYENILPIDFEILDVGTKDNKIVLIGASRSVGRVSERVFRFLIHPSLEPLPKKDNFSYYWYVGSIPRKGLHIFEVV